MTNSNTVVPLRQPRLPGKDRDALLTFYDFPAEH